MKIEVQSLTIEQDEGYFRIIAKFGDTHKLHSEKLNLDTAIALLFELKGSEVKTQ